MKAGRKLVRIEKRGPIHVGQVRPKMEGPYAYALCGAAGLAEILPDGSDRCLDLCAKCLRTMTAQGKPE